MIHVLTPHTPQRKTVIREGQRLRCGVTRSMGDRGRRHREHCLRSRTPPRHPRRTEAAPNVACLGAASARRHHATHTVCCKRRADQSSHTRHMHGLRAVHATRRSPPAPPRRRRSSPKSPGSRPPGPGRTARSPAPRSPCARAVLRFRSTPPCFAHGSSTPGWPTASCSDREASGSRSPARRRSGSAGRCWCCRTRPGSPSRATSAARSSASRPA